MPISRRRWRISLYLSLYLPQEMEDLVALLPAQYVMSTTLHDRLVHLQLLKRLRAQPELQVHQHAGPPYYSLARSLAHSTHTLTHSRTHALTHALTRSLARSLAHSLAHSPTSAASPSSSGSTSLAWH